MKQVPMSIRIKLTVLILSLVTIPLVIVSLVTFGNYQKSLETARLIQMQDVSRFKAGRIEIYFVQLTSNAWSSS